MKGEQYDSLVKLMRGDPNSASNQAARRVLVDGLTQADAVRETNQATTRQAVSKAVGRFADADKLVRHAYGVSSHLGSELMQDDPKALLALIPQQSQRQDASDAQLSDLIAFATRLGLYDAADVIKALVDKKRR